MSRPNILLIMADQMAPQLTGAYGHPVVCTPNLEALCDRGVRFDAAYTNSPICAPARASMLTGQYVSSIGTYDNGVNFAADIPTFLHALRLSGYEVVASGKMHYLGPDQLHGLERRLTQDVYPAGFKWIPDWQEQRESGVANDKGFLVEPGETGPAPWSNQLNYDEDTHSRALEYLRRKFYTKGEPLDPRRQELDRPFCLIVSYTQPHSPYITSQHYWDLYEGKTIALPHVLDPKQYKDSEIIMDRWLRDYEGIPNELMENEDALRRMRRAYYGMVTYIDDKVGELVNCLDQLGLADNTAIIYTADHGDMVGERGFIEKRVFYEFSSRIPMICSFPGHWLEGRRIEHPVSLIDIFPTLVDIASTSFPFHVDGNSLLPLLAKNRTDDADPSEQVAIAEYHCEGVLAPCFMVRKGKYKYIHVHGHVGESQLFDLNADPRELTNLSGDESHAKLEKELREIILNRFDGNAIEQQVIAKQKRCKYIHEAMMAGEKKTSWDIRPNPDADTKYDQ